MYPCSCSCIYPDCNTAGIVSRLYNISRVSSLSVYFRFDRGVINYSNRSSFKFDGYSAHCSYRRMFTNNDWNNNCVCKQSGMSGCFKCVSTHLLLIYFAKVQSQNCVVPKLTCDNAIGYVNSLSSLYFSELQYISNISAYVSLIVRSRTLDITIPLSY